MTRLGWSFLGLFALLGLGFASLVHLGGPPALRPLVAEAPVPAEPTAAPGLLAVPVAGIPRGALRDSWGEARDGGARGHHGTDIIAPPHAQVIAAAAGRIEKLFQSRLGGITLYQRSADGRWLYYYAHLAGYAAGLREGQAVRAGEPLGFVGDTGDAGPGNFHLHFGLSRLAPGEHWWQGTDVDPFPYLAGTASVR